MLNWYFDIFGPANRRENCLGVIHRHSMLEHSSALEDVWKSLGSDLEAIWMLLKGYFRNDFENGRKNVLFAHLRIPGWEALLCFRNLCLCRLFSEESSYNAVSHTTCRPLTDACVWWIKLWNQMFGSNSIVTTKSIAGLTTFWFFKLLHSKLLFSRLFFEFSKFGFESDWKSLSMFERLISNQWFAMLGGCLDDKRKFVGMMNEKFVGLKDAVYSSMSVVNWGIRKSNGRK